MPFNVENDNYTTWHTSQGGEEEEEVVEEVKYP